MGARNGALVATNDQIMHFHVNVHTPVLNAVVLLPRILPSV
jgi:hypothetical protein